MKRRSGDEFEGERVKWRGQYEEKRGTTKEREFTLLRGE
jgi:hypothetical protein